MKKNYDNIQIIRGDITTAKVDCIVNAANKWLIPGGGVDHAIHQAAGPELAIAVKKFHRCEPGHAVITPGFHLKATYVIHAVGPIWDEYEKIENLKQVLSKTYQSIYELAEQHSIQTIAIPNISTGIYDFPKDLAAEIALQTTFAFLKTSQSKMRIFFYCFESDNYEIYTRLIQKLEF
ncbi:MAG: macro domain-containing protein [Bacilli bacterium]